MNDQFDFSQMTRANYTEYDMEQKDKEGFVMCAPIAAIRYKTPEELLALCDQTDSIPVDLDRLLKRIKISCKKRQFPDVRNGSSSVRVLGALVTNGDNAIIYYDENSSRHRFRFTIAHELAHCCLAHYNIGASSVHFRLEGDPSDELECDANIFAGKLLIPEQSLIKVLSQLLLPSVRALADIFDVSENVMLARLRTLKLDNSILGYNC